MFKQKEEYESSHKESVETIIGPSVKVEGNFMGEGDVVVEGEITGSFKTKGNLKVGENAKIKADVEASNITVAGDIRGNIKVYDKTNLLSTAKVNGDIETKIISIETGAIIKGRCQSGAEPKESSQDKGELKKNNNKESKTNLSPVL